MPIFYFMKRYNKKYLYIYYMVKIQLGGGKDLNCSGLVIVSIIMAILIFIKEFRPWLSMIPDFLSNFIHILSAAFSMDGYLMKCTLGDHAGNDHGKMVPPKVTHMAQDKKDHKDKEIKDKKARGEPEDPLDDYDEEKLLALEKARQDDLQFKKERAKKEGIETFTVKDERVDEKGKEVFTIDRNLFEFKEAEAVCKHYNSEVATYSQVEEAQKNGANWCNYGWIKNGQAVYPIQKDFYDNLTEKQKAEKHCGEGQAIVGGFMPSKNIRLGVTCYGVKPNADPARLDSTNSEGKTNDFIDNDENRIANIVRQKIADNKVDFLSYNQKSFSQYSPKDVNQVYLSQGALDDNQEKATALADTKTQETFVNGNYLNKKNKKISGKELIEQFVFDNKELTEEFYSVIKAN